MIIYSAHKSPRLEYVLNYIFKDTFGVFVDLVHDNSTKNIDINYSNDEDVHAKIQILPHGVLYENKIEEFSVETSRWNNTVTLFPNDSGDLPFDLFSAVFYLISRYEEYLSFNGDKHQRFTAKESFAYKNGFLELPIIDIWLKDFAEFWNNKSNSTELELPIFKTISSIDIDSAYAYVGKGLFRTIGAIAKDKIRLDYKNLFARLKTLLWSKEDPFDTYDEFLEINNSASIESIFFVPTSDYGPNDVNLPHWSARYIRLVRKLAEKNTIGIHPGYVSNFYPQKVKEEIKRLQQMHGKEVNHSRQHFLILEFPKTYRNLIENGISEDYTMGFADRIGFRAGTSRSFLFFDLEKNQETNLRVHPFPVMDVTLNLYMELSPDEAISQLKNIIDQVKSTGGTFIPLWHNESLSTYRHWNGWNRVYREMINYCK